MIHCISLKDHPLNAHLIERLGGDRFANFTSSDRKNMPNTLVYKHEKSQYVTPQRHAPFTDAVKLLLHG